jgi:hypothetical protein
MPQACPKTLETTPMVNALARYRSRAAKEARLRPSHKLDHKVGRGCSPPISSGQRRVPCVSRSTPLSCLDYRPIGV